MYSPTNTVSTHVNTPSDPPSDRTISWNLFPWQTSRQSVSNSQNQRRPTLNNLVTGQNQNRMRHSQSEHLHGLRPSLDSVRHLSSYNVMGQCQIDNLPNLLWGPPPPYSQPSSLGDSHPGGESGTLGTPPRGQEDTSPSQDNNSSDTQLRPESPGRLGTIVRTIKSETVNSSQERTRSNSLPGNNRQQNDSIKQSVSYNSIINSVGDEIRNNVIKQKTSE